MITKLIDGTECVQRDVVYSDFGAATETEKRVATIKSSEEYKSADKRSELFLDRTYSWTKEDNPYIYDDVDRQFSDIEDTKLPTELEEGSEDREYSAILSTRLITLRRPLHIQLREINRDHARFYRSKGKQLKMTDMDLLIDDFRYELHRIIAKAKDLVIKDGGNMDTILKVSSLGGGSELQATLRKLTILFKRVEQAYEKFGFIPRTYQTKMNDALSILISHFILDVYGPELEKRKLESSELASKTVTR